MIPASPGWRAALFSEFLFRLVRGEGELLDHATATDAELRSLLDVAPVLAWVVTPEGMRPATPLGVWTDPTASGLLLAPAGAFDGVLLGEVLDLEWRTARTDAEMLAWARGQVRTRLCLERLEDAHWRVAEAGDAGSPIPGSPRGEPREPAGEGSLEPRGEPGIRGEPGSDAVAIMLDAGGVALLAGAHAFRACPDRWTTAKAAERAIARSEDKRRAGAVRFRYRLAGPRMQPCAGLVAAEQVDGLAGWLTARLGALAFFEIEGGLFGAADAIPGVVLRGDVITTTERTTA